MARLDDATIQRLCPSGMWSIIRKPRQGAAFSLRDVSVSKDRLVQKYDEAFANIRQGCIALIAPDGTIERIASGPNLRTRW